MAVAMPTACDVEAIRQAQGWVAGLNLVVTVLVMSLFVWTKKRYNNVRQRMARCTVFIIGGGPTGMTSALLASQNPHVARVIIFEELTRTKLLAKAHQLEFNRKSRDLLVKLGVDFDAIEGCCDDRVFHTRVGVFLEHVMDRLNHSKAPVTFRMGVKFTSEQVLELERYPGRKIVIASDGSSGQSARLLGLSDEFLHTSCNAFGAVASMDRIGEDSVPVIEKRVHGLYFDLTSYGIDQNRQDMASTTGFSLKLSGTTQHRYLSLALPRSEDILVRSMRLVLDRSMMRNIFIQCFNTYKTSKESRLLETWALRNLTFSPRLFDIKVFQRIETAAFYQETDMVVLVEGEAARCSNFHTGLDVNMALAGLMSLNSVLTQTACALTDLDMLKTLTRKSRHGNLIAKQFVRNGLRNDIFTVS